MADTLTTTEQAALQDYEATIESGLQTFYDVGEALLAIRDKRLYRRDYATFEQYCLERWSMSKTHANRLISTSEVVANLTPIGVILPRNEAQTRPLTTLPPEQQIEAWQTAVTSAGGSIPTARQVAEAVEVIRRPQGVPLALQASDNNEWYTPPPYVNAARDLMGGIDVDPASNPIANNVIQAALYYTLETNGLDKEWPGRVWLNPPYGRDGDGSNQERWSARLVQQFEAGITTEAVLLVNAVTDRKWFQPLWNYPICFPDHRIRFYDEDGVGGQPTHGNALVYFGLQMERFIELFRQFGVIVGRIDGR